MKRRKFLLTSGSTILTGFALGSLQRPAVGVDFELANIPDENPEDVNSILVGFDKLEITPQYLSETEKMTIQADVDVETQTKQSNEFQMSFKNGETIDIKNNLDPILIDGINTENLISGKVTVSVDHPDIQDSYSRKFNISGKKVPDDQNLYARYDATKLSETDGNTVKKWEDSSGNQFTLENYRGSPTYDASSFNGNPTVKFTKSSGDSMWTGTDNWEDIKKPVTFYWVGETINTDKLSVIVSEKSTGSYPHMVKEGVNQWYMNWTEYHDSDGFTDGAQLVCCQFSDSQAVTYESGNEVLKTSDPTTPTWTATALGSYYLGDKRHPSMRMGEFLFFDSDHNNTTRDEVFSYLSNKWGVTY
jgi:hypothetical protein